MVDGLWRSNNHKHTHARAHACAHTHTHAHWELQVGNDTICLWFQLSNMRTLTPSEREQCNLVTINCMLKLSHGPAVYLVQGSTDTGDVGECGLGLGQWGLHWPCLVKSSPYADPCTHVWLSSCFLWLSVKEACWTGWEREENRVGSQAGTHHPSPQEIKVNNQDLTSCSRNLIMLWSESLWQCVCEQRCVCIYRIRVSVLHHNPNPLSLLRVCVIAAQLKSKD